ncbi:MAG: ECF RNA polymerase sigma factor SigW [Phycisphaerae bacterium]|nr:ECF RNA polymerase sigma factor SigW [Phycisphaerae bacterium]
MKQMATEISESQQPLTRLVEQRLIRKILKGDQAAARALIDYYKQRLFAFVWRSCPNHQDAEDICQEAFLKAFAALDSYDPQYRFSTWLFTIAYRLSLNHRRRSAEKQIDGDYAWPADDQESFETALAQTEEAEQLRKQVWSAVARLAKPQQAAIVLFYREHLPCEEIARVMNIPVSTVKSHLHRGRTRLRELLESVVAGDWSKLRILGSAAG